MSAATSKVYRDGNLVTVKSEDLVPGDVISLEAGDAVPADSRIIECASLKVEEAALTGESVPVNKKVDTLSLGDQKDVPLGDRKTCFITAPPLYMAAARLLLLAPAWIPKWAKSQLLLQKQAKAKPRFRKTEPAQ